MILIRIGVPCTVAPFLADPDYGRTNMVVAQAVDTKMVRTEVPDPMHVRAGHQDKTMY